MKKIDWSAVIGIGSVLLFITVIILSLNIAIKIDSKNFKEQMAYEQIFVPTEFMHDVYKFDCSNGKEYLAYLDNGNWHIYPDGNKIKFDDSWFGGVKCNKITTDIKTK